MSKDARLISKQYELIAYPVQAYYGEHLLPQKMRFSNINDVQSAIIEISSITCWLYEIITICTEEVYEPEQRRWRIQTSRLLQTRQKINEIVPEL